jgi:hypothetical protein
MPYFAISTIEWAIRHIVNESLPEALMVVGSLGSEI